MLISKSIYYGTRGLAYLASKKHFSSIQEIAKEERIPSFFLEKIFQRFKKAGLIGSKKGIGGGFFLALPPRKITLKKIIRALTKEKTSIPCLNEYKKNHCPVMRICLIKKTWQRFYQNLDSSLENFTLADFLR